MHARHTASQVNALSCTWHHVRVRGAGVVRVWYLLRAVMDVRWVCVQLATRVQL